MAENRKITLNTLWCWCTIVLCSALYTSSQELEASNNIIVTGLKLPLTTLRVKRETATTCDEKKPAMQCAPDCKNLLFCDSTTILGRFPCPSANPNCDLVLNTCVAKRPADQCPASQENTEYLCPGDEGYFPDPTNCRIYNYCDKKKVAISYTCPVTFAFDMALSQCRRLAPCGFINCIGRIVAVHSTYPYLYAFCNNNAIVEGSYSQCEQTTQEFDLNEFECKAKCRTEGNIPHETDCAKYYRCLATGIWGALEKTEQSCPPGQNFNKKKLICDKTAICP